MAVFLIGYAADSVASDSELGGSLLSCSNIENDAKRLDCVDELVQSIENQAVVESIKPQSSQQPIAEKSSANDSSGNELGQKYLRMPEESMAPTSQSYDLIAVYQDDEKRWTFEFDNGQVWQQIESRYLPKPKNLPVRVTISEGVFGSHDLRAENYGKAVKVKRLK